MSSLDYHSHDETVTTEVAVVIHVEGPVSSYDLGIAVEKLRNLLRYDSIEKRGREASLTFATATPLSRFELAEVTQGSATILP